MTKISMFITYVTNTIRALIDGCVKNGGFSHASENKNPPEAPYVKSYDP
jgi:hypothetical protein